MGVRWWWILGAAWACAPLTRPTAGESVTTYQPPVTRVEGAAADAACALEGARCERPGGWPGQCCRGECVAYDDPRHCGACGRACGDDGACHQGECIGPACGPGGGPCVLPGGGHVGACCGDACADLLRDPAHCGACGHGCPGGACVGGLCVVDRCKGAPAGSRCRRGAAAPGMCCGGACVDDTTDGANCGACGQSCPPATACQRGLCLPAHGESAGECSAGWTCVESAFGTQCGRSDCEPAPAAEPSGKVPGHASLARPDLSVRRPE